MTAVRRDETIDGVEGKEAALIDDGDAITEALGFFHVMGCVDDGGAAGLEFADQIENAVAALRIDTCGGFIQEQERRVVEQGGGEIEAALHAAGKALDTIGASGSEADEIKRLIDAGLAFIGGHGVETGKEG